MAADTLDSHPATATSSLVSPRLSSNISVTADVCKAPSITFTHTCTGTHLWVHSQRLINIQVSHWIIFWVISAWCVWRSFSESTYSEGNCFLLYRPILEDHDQMSKMWEIVCLPWSKYMQIPLLWSKRTASLLCRYILKFSMYEGKRIKSSSALKVLT